MSVSSCHNLFIDKGAQLYHCLHCNIHFENEDVPMTNENLYMLLQRLVQSS